MKIEQECSRDIGWLLGGTEWLEVKRAGDSNALNDKVLHSYVLTLYYALADYDFLHEGLLHLEKALVAQVGGKEKEIAAQAYYKAMEAFNKKSPEERDQAVGQGQHPNKGSLFNDAFSGALTKVFSASQKKGKFPDFQVTIAKASNPGDISNLRAFAGLQKVGQHFKDINAGSEHGEFTHQIQWYIITEFWGQINISAAEWYKSFVWEKFPGYESPAALMMAIGKTGMKAVGLWPMLFDRVQKTVNGLYLVTTDSHLQTPDKLKYKSGHLLEGRCPEVLHAYLRYMKNDYPTLRAFLRARYAKRQAEEQDVKFDYHTKKVKQGLKPYDDAHYLSVKKEERKDSDRVGYLKRPVVDEKS